MNCVQSCVKICLEKIMLCDLTNVETFLGGGLFGRFASTSDFAC